MKSCRIKSWYKIGLWWNEGQNSEVLMRGVKIIILVRCWRRDRGPSGSGWRATLGPPRAAIICFCYRKGLSAWTAPTCDKTSPVSISTFTSTCCTPRPAETFGYVSRVSTLKNSRSLFCVCQLHPQINIQMRVLSLKQGWNHLPWG